MFYVLQDIAFSSVYICNTNSIRKSFIDPIHRDESNDFLDIFLKEYFVGNDEEDSDRLTSNQNKLRKIETKMKELYNWNNKITPNWLGAHSCSDMILYAGK